MKRRIMWALPAVAVVATCLPISFSGSASANALCGTAATDKDSSAWNATGSGAYMRSGSSTSCSINGRALTGHRLDYHCYTVGEDGYTWTYLRDDSANPDVYGWVRDNLLSDHGSRVPC
ncbi:SH3 domain-containing protein [Streptomyces sp. NPDC046881]|uniref:SH3 domain-containing protein n=1 Tax=Streptomyces sp. NPDC046881 TaxID=3155374 RepID=UPI0033DAB5CB